MSRELQVACAIILKENFVIITQRSESMRLPLKWEFPGGKVEKNESAEECIHREIFEELNIQITLKKRLKNSIYCYPDHIVCLIPFYC